MQLSFSRLLKGSAFNVISKIAGAFFGLLAHTMITAQYGAGVIGTIATVTSVFTLLSVLFLFGNQTLVFKLIPQYINDYSHSVAFFVYKRMLMVVSCLIFIGLSLWLAMEVYSDYSMLDNLHQFVPTVAILTIFAAFLLLNTRTLRAMGDYKVFSVFEVLPSFLMWITITAAVSVNVSSANYTYLHFWPYILLCALSFSLILRRFSREIGSVDDCKISASSVPSHKKILQTAFPMFGVTVSTVLLTHFDVIMLNHYWTKEVVGVYFVYVKISTLTIFATRSINSMLAPTISTLFKKGDQQDFKHFLKKATLLSFSCTLIMSIFIFMVHKPLLSYFGDEFLLDKNVLFILLAGTLVSSYFGSVGLFLNMTGRQKNFFKVMMGAALINVVLNTLLIPGFGIYGAAVSTFISVVYWNLAATYIIYRASGYTLIWTKCSHATT